MKNKRSLNPSRKVSGTSVKIFETVFQFGYFSLIKIVISLTWRVIIGFEIGRSILLMNEDYAKANYETKPQENSTNTESSCSVNEDTKMLSEEVAFTFNKVLPSSCVPIIFD